MALKSANFTPWSMSDKSTWFPPITNSGFLFLFNRTGSGICFVVYTFSCILKKHLCWIYTNIFYNQTLVTLKLQFIKFLPSIFLLVTKSKCINWFMVFVEFSWILRRSFYVISRQRLLAGNGLLNTLNECAGKHV